MCIMIIDYIINYIGGNFHILYAELCDNLNYYILTILQIKDIACTLLLKTKKQSEI